MSYEGKLNKKLNKLYDGKIEAREENECLILSGEVERWSDVVTAGRFAVAENPYSFFVNEVTCTVDKAMPVRTPQDESSSLDLQDPDVLIIGAGIIGCAVARELSRYNLSVLLIDKEHDVAVQASGRSNGMVHSGANLKAGTVRQRYCKSGYQMFPKVCEELGVAFNQCGQYLCYTNRLWQPFLFISLLYWKMQGYKNINIVTGDELHSREPGINRDIGSAIFFPSAGVVSPHDLTIAYAENSVQNGTVIAFNTMVTDITVEDNAIKSVVTNRGTIRPRVVVNAAGVFSDEIAKMVGDRFFSIHPVKCTNAVIDKKHAKNLTRSFVTVRGAGGGKINHRKKDIAYNISQSAHGSIIAGFETRETIHKEDYSIDQFSADRLMATSKRIFPEINADKVIRYFAGVSAATYDEDFIISRGWAVSNVVHIAGIQVPGITASPAIAVDVADMITDMFGGKASLGEKSDFNPIRTAPPTLSKMSPDMRDKMISENSNYGIVICRCQDITKGEVTEALNRNVRCDSLDGVKRRVKTGMGCCQGQHCNPRVLEIIAAETRHSRQHIRKCGSGSEIVFGNVKSISRGKLRAVPSTTRRESSADDELIARIQKHTEYTAGK